MRKFQRNYQLFIQISENKNDVLLIEYPITIDFNIIRNTSASINTMDINIYNLNETNRDAIFKDKFNIKKQRNIVLKAGYGDNLFTVFKGNILWAYNKKEKVDVITSIHAMDGLYSQNNSFTAESFAGGTTRRDILKNLMGGLVGAEQGQIGDFNEEASRRGLALNGNTFELIKTQSGNNAFFDLEKCNILNKNEVISGDVFLLNDGSGLLGTPERADALLKIEYLFEPRVTIGQVVAIESIIAPQFDGQYKVVGIEHSGIISGSKNGEIKTSLNLLTAAFGQEQGVKPESFNLVDGDNIIPLNNAEISTDIKNIRDILIKTGVAPKIQITRNVSWNEMLVNYSSQGEIPSLQVLAELKKTAEALQKILDTYFKGRTVIITSGWRSRTYNSNIKNAAENSLHIQGKAVDFIVNGVPDSVVQRTLDPVYIGGLEYQKGYTHIDTRGYKSRFFAPKGS